MILLNYTPNSRQNGNFCIFHHLKVIFKTLCKMLNRIMSLLLSGNIVFKNRSN
jgi:hypothetical protein